MDLYSFLLIKENFIPNNILNIILNYKNSNFKNAGVVLNNINKMEFSDYRKTKILHLPNDVVNNLYNSIFLIHEQLFKKKYNSKLKNIERPLFLKYEVDDHYDVHNDCENFNENNQIERVCDRDLTVLFYLNNDYDGGELELTNLQLTIKPKAGMMIAFPSYIEFSHKVHPIKNGTRYNIVSWLSTEKTIYPRPY